MQKLSNSFYTTFQEKLDKKVIVLSHVVFEFKDHSLTCLALPNYNLLIEKRIYIVSVAF